jgi:putative ABC transport system permease protein
MAWRTIRKHTLNSTLNIVGLALGMACSLLILFFLRAEISYEKPFANASRIYRVTNESLEENGLHWAVISPVHALEIQRDIPEIEAAARMFKCYTQVLSYDDGTQVKRFQETTGYCADPQILDMFDIELLQGDRQTALQDVNTMVITESFAQRYFEDENPIGKVMRDEQNFRDLTITGVIPDLPVNTHLNYQFLISMPTLYTQMEDAGAADWMVSRGWAHFYTYVLFNPAADMQAVQQKLKTFTENFYASWFEHKNEVHQYLTLNLQPITDIHLNSHLEQEMGANSNIIYIYVFALIVVLVLLLAGVNFVNLSIAQAFSRMQEVGVRKVIGANRKRLITQFLIESLLLAGLAALLALLLIELSLPYYRAITHLHLTLGHVLTSDNLLIVIAMVLLSGILAGLYPSFFMSHFSIIDALRSKKTPRSSASHVRNFLVIFQFAISVFMIFSTIIIYQQMSFFQQKNLGFDTQQVIALELHGNLRTAVTRDAGAFKDALLSHSAISHVALTSNLPGERFSVEDIRHPSIPDGATMPPIRYLRVDTDFLETMGIELTEGESFKNWSNDNPAFIINERTRSLLPLEHPVGEVVSNFRGTQGEIIGIVKDFNYASLRESIEPLVIELNPRWASKVLIRTSGGSIPDIIAFLKETVEKTESGSIFEFSFLDDRLNMLYENEQRLNTIFKIFSVLAIVISCLGLFGLSAYYTQLRTKEIGIRKVLGASLPSVIRLLSLRFFIWVLIANAIALPLAWLAMQRWLQNFAYKISISPLVCATALVTSILIALLTVSFRTVGAAVKNPVESLKYE